MAKVTLDPETFKALASPTRLSVLRALDERRKTVTELARDLAMNKATIHEHLQLLSAADLVAKKDEGRKWIYYELTWRGQRILHPQETTTFNLLLAVSVAAAGGGLAMLGRAMDWWWTEQQSDGVFMPFESGPAAEGTEDSGEGGDEGEQRAFASDTATEAPPEDAPAHDAADGFWDEDGILSIIILGLSILSAVLAALLWRRLRPARPPVPKGEAPDA